MFTNPFRRGRGVDRWPKLARVINKGGGQDGAHALGVGAQGQGDAKGDDNGVLAFGCRGHPSSMSPSPALVEARDLAGIVGAMDSQTTLKLCRLLPQRFPHRCQNGGADD